MANSGYIDSLLGSLPSEMKQPISAAFEYTLGNLSLGAVENQTRATNLQAYYLTGTTPSVAQTEFSLAHGLGFAPSVLIPVIGLEAIGQQIVPLQVSRAADETRIYLKSSSTSAAIAVLVG